MKPRNIASTTGSLTRVILLLTLVSLGGTLAEAKTLKVPRKFTTIQEAIDAASSGDTIKISKGRYTGNIVIDKSLTIRGKKYKTRIQAADDSSPVVTVTADDVELKQFDTRGGSFGVAADGVSGLKLQSMRVVGAQSDGMFFRHVDNVFINKCKAYSNGVSGIVIEAANGGGIKKCRVYRNGRDGIEIQQGQGIRVDSCRFYENGTMGIRIAGGDGVRVVKNRCWENARGMFIYGDVGEGLPNPTNCLIENNTFYDNQSAGFSASEAQGIVRKNVSRNNRFGFRDAEAFATQLLFKDNRAEGNSEDGFSLGSLGTVLDGNNSIDNQRYGFHLLGGDGASSLHLEDNLASGNVNHGFFVEEGSSDHTFEDNRSVSNGGDGFYIASDAASVITGNFADGNSGFGFVDEGSDNPSAPNTFVGNECGGNNGAGESSPVGLCD